MQCQFLDTCTVQHQFIDWTKEELKELHGKTRKYLTSTILLLRKIGGRVLCSVEDCVELTTLSLFYDVACSQEELFGGSESVKVWKALSI